MWKSILLHLCCVCCLSFTAGGQNSRVVDSLLRAIDGLPEGERFPIYFDLAFEYIDRDNQRALDFIFQAEHAALLSGDSLFIVKSKRVKGQLFHLLEDATEAKRVFLDVLPVATRHGFSREVLFMQIALANVLVFQGRYDSALNVNFNALALAKDEESKEAMADILHNIGIAYYKLKNCRKALDYFLESVELYDQRPGGSIQVLANVGLCYFNLGDLSMARFYVEKGLKNCGSGCPDRLRINSEYALGVISRGEKQVELAERHFLASYFLAKLCNDTRFQFDNVYLLSQLYIEQKRFTKAELYLTAAEKMITPNTPFNLEMIKIYAQFAELYRSTGNHKKSSHYQYKYIQLKDSVYNEELTNGLMQAEAEFLERENKAKILAQQEVIVLNEEIIRRKTMVNILVASVGIVILGLLISVVRIYRDKRDMNILLDRKVEERTRELQIIRNELLHALGERDVKINDTHNDITETVNSIKGLCYLGMRDLSEPVARLYMKKIENMASRLANWVAGE